MIRLDRLHWLWLALAAPFLLFPSAKAQPGLAGHPWLVAAAYLCLQTSAIRNPQSAVRNPQFAIPQTPLNGVLLLLGLMVLVSEWATFDLAYSLPKISGMVLGFGVFFAVAREGERPRGWTLNLLAFLGIGLGIAGLGLLGTRWASSKITFLDPIIARFPTLIQGLQGAETGLHPNEVAGALIWVLPLMMAVSIALMASFFRSKEGKNTSPQRTQSTRSLFSSPRPPKNGGTRKRRKQGGGDSPQPSKNRGTRTLRESRWNAEESVGTPSKLNGWRLVVVMILCLLATFFVAAVFLLTQSRGGTSGWR